MATGGVKELLLAGGGGIEVEVGAAADGGKVELAATIVMELGGVDVSVARVTVDVLVGVTVLMIAVLMLMLVLVLVLVLVLMLVLATPPPPPRATTPTVEPVTDDVATTRESVALEMAVEGDRGTTAITDADGVP